MKVVGDLVGVWGDDETPISNRYIVILARIILKHGAGGVGPVNHIKARANDVESFLITPCKPA